MCLVYESLTHISYRLVIMIIYIYCETSDVIAIAQIFHAACRDGLLRASALLGDSPCRQ